jgi:uncharacterized repeat protein (TIGR03803 family)
MVIDAAGNLYGTTLNGGAYQGGAVFKLTPAGVETLLYSFDAVLGDGYSPQGARAMDSAGNLYGTTLFGGLSGFGAVFEVDSIGTETLLHSFEGTDGKLPLAGILLDSVGNLYGTTSAGGAYGGGTVFKITP